MKSLITFINKTDSPAPQVVFFNRNLLAAENKSVVAWKTICHCQPMHSHPLLYSNFFEVGVSDADGNFSPRLSAASGGIFAVNKTAAHRNIAYLALAKNARRFEIKNNLLCGSLNAHVFLEKEIYATQKNIAPGQRALFEFDYGLSIAVADQNANIESGFIDGKILLSTEQKILLHGISSAKIMMKKTDYSYKEYQFVLGDVNH